MNRLREEAFLCHWVILSRIAFQACSFIRLRSRLSPARAAARCLAVAAPPRRRTTTRTSLRLESTTYGRATVGILLIVISPPMCRNHLRVFSNIAAPLLLPLGERPTLVKRAELKCWRRLRKSACATVLLNADQPLGRPRSSSQIRTFNHFRDRARWLLLMGSAATDGFESVMLRNRPRNRAGSLRSTTSPVP